MRLQHSGPEAGEETFRLYLGPGRALPYAGTVPPRQSCSPEKRLMLAILEDALKCREEYRDATNTRGKRLFREAESWFQGDGGADWIFSFDYVCEVLGYDPAWIRRAASGQFLGGSAK